MNDIATTEQTTRRSLIERFANRYDVEPAKLMGTLKSTAFKTKEGDPPVTDEQMMALLIVAEQYGLNPWTKEIYAFPDKSAGIVPVLSVDGWARIINEHPQFDGLEFSYAEQTDEKAKHCPIWIGCTLHRKDRSHAHVVREYLDECKRGTGPWGSHPKRMLRHKALIQAARIVFSFAGIFDSDEAERIIEGEVISTDSAAWADVNKQIEQKPAQDGSAEPPKGLLLSAGNLIERINAATNVDELSEVQDLIGEFKSAKDRKSLIEAVELAEARIGAPAS